LLLILQLNPVYTVKQLWKCVASVGSLHCSG